MMLVGVVDDLGPAALRLGMKVEVTEVEVTVLVRLGIL